MENSRKPSFFDEFQKLFAELTGLPISFINANADFIKLSKGSKRFCALVAETEKKTGLSNCWISNYKACKKAVASKKPLIYECHAGLTEIIVPIISEGKALGALITGQFRISGKSRYKPVNIPPGVSVTAKLLLREFNEMPEFKRPKVMAIARMLDMFANTVFVNEISNLYEHSPKPLTSNMQRALHIATSYIHHNYRNSSLSLDNVAEQVNLNPCHISHIFRKELNTTFVDYLTRIRIEETARQLKNNPEKSIKEIAYQTGYSDQYYFSKVFKRIYNSSPLNFRRKYM